MVITAKNVIERLRKEDERKENERKHGCFSATSFDSDWMSYLTRHKYWREFVASKMRGEWKVKDLVLNPRYLWDGSTQYCGLKISVILFDNDTCKLSIYKKAETSQWISAVRGEEERPREMWISETFPVEELGMIDRIGVKYRPKAIEEEIESLKATRKGLDKRIKDLKNELKNLTA